MLATTTVDAVLAVAGAAVALAALCVIIHRRPESFPLLAIAALPFRLPISAEGRTVNLLIPLYLVVAAGTLVLLVPRIWRRREPAPRGLEWLLVATVGLYALQAAYSTDAAKAAENLAFFYVPFALLFVLLRDVRWTRGLLLSCLALAAGLAVVLAGVGFIEYGRKELSLTLRQARHVLSDRDRLVLHLRFVEDMTQSEIGKRIGVSQMQVSRILRAATERLRSELGDEAAALAAA